MHRTLTARHDRFALTRPFRIARGVRTEADMVTVSIRAGALEGKGEGVPHARHGESVENALAAIEGVRPAIEAGAGREELLALLPAGAARNAVDCALWDLEARGAGRSVAALLGAPEPEPVASARTIVIDTPMMMGCAARRLAQAPLLKVKVDGRLPDAQIRAVRAAAPDARLIVDPNESWDARLVEAMQPVLAELKVDLLEQPVAAAIDACLETFRPLVPIAADESLHTREDLDQVARRYQVVNVKLDKAGGLTEGLRLAEAARARGLGLMTGCMVSSSLSVAAALHLARMSDFVDLDGPIWLAKDRPGGVEDRGGTLYPPLPGFWGTP
ncbi:dipeptide epimerase [Sphingomonas sp. CBMAI 2297]|uniref:N-acetyl-D-Glu racemase DgcA n=1 Tax=Sphingomonas sp. CBMAI 2297 TaxID=2991720 RepID=UPI0024584F1A|nr:N-acetyl-D-Glu racemase DgcA [Sphingomonas sp. CBMAI 2297]MDH4743584.1 dipeptide epimerase [Sphingomonas sp. CBMAI 2297]